MIKIGSLTLPDFPLILAPMEDVTDPPFRSLCVKNGADLVFTEFISSEGLIRNASKSIKKLDIYEYERPIGIQIFGGEIGSMIESAEIVENSKPDILDINYGCPVKKVVCKNAGAGILLQPDKMIKMTAEIVKRTKLPVTVKTRLGWDDKSIHIVEIAERLQDVGIQAISIHGRTRQQMYKGSADWSFIKKVKENPRMKIPVFGNGDVNSPEKAIEMKNEYGLDGAMIGRAAIGYPWIFKEIRHFINTGKHLQTPSVEERIYSVKQHLDFSIDWKGEKTAILEIRKHYHNYFKNISHFKEYRQKLVLANTPEELHFVLDSIQKNFSI